MAQTLSARRRIFAVIAGGFCGTLLRVVLSSLIQGEVGKAWPYDILLINVTGALLLAFVTTLADATILVGPTRRLFINVGLLGAYTTFSSLALGDVLLIARGQWLSALAYLVISSLGGIVAVLLGDLLGQKCVRRVRLATGPKTPRILAGPQTHLAPIPPDATVTREHVDVQDDLLLSEQERNRGRRS